MAIPSERSFAPAATLVGLLWSTVLFANDTWEAWIGFRKGLNKVDADAETQGLILAAIVDYVVRIAFGHAILAVLGSLWLWSWLRLLVPDTRRPALWALLFGGLSTLSLYGWQITLLPTLHDWFPWRSAWVAVFTPGVLAVLHGVIGLGLAVWLVRSWRHDLLALGRRLVPLAALVLGWMAVEWEPAPEAAVGNAGPNVVLIGIDSLRPDHLASQGYFRDTAPHIDAFLEEAVLFEHAWTPLARTYPSWMSLLTGALPIDLGIRDNLPAPDALVPGRPTLPQVLSEQGWHTTFVTDDSRFSYMVPELGWQTIVQPPVDLQNFVVSSNEPHYRAFHAFFHNRLGDALLPTGAFNQSFGKSYRPLRFIARASQALAEASRHERFFYASHACFLHAPGDRIWPWHSMHGQEGYDGRNRFRYLRSGSALFLNDGTPKDASGPLSEQDVRIYDSGIDMADRHVAETMAQLAEAGLLDDTIVVLFSDHGEEHYAEDLPYAYMGPNHGFHPYGDGQLRVLMAVRFPDGLGAGETVAGHARLMDLLPTLIEALGLTWPGELGGRSLLPLVRGEEADPENSRQVYVETGVSERRYWNEGHLGYPFDRVSERYVVHPETGRVHIRAEFFDHLVAAKDRVLQRGRWKLVYRPMEPAEGQLHRAQIELFDRVADPLNRTDLSGLEPEVLAELGLELVEHLRSDGIEIPQEREWATLVAETADVGGESE